MLQKTVLATICTGLLFSPLASASDEASDTQDMYVIGDITCKEVMILSGDERDEVVSFMHGYLAGEAKKTGIDVVKLATATDVFLDRCLDSPQDKALATMRSSIPR